MYTLSFVRLDPIIITLQSRSIDTSIDSICSRVSVLYIVSVVVFSPVLHTHKHLSLDTARYICMCI